MMDYSTAYQTAKNNVRKNKAVIVANSVAKNKPSFNNSYKLSKQLGKAISGELMNIAGGLDESDSLEEFSRMVVAKMYSDGQKSMLEVSRRAQAEVLKNANIGLSPVNVGQDINRLNHIIERFANAESLEDVIFLCSDSVAQNILKSAVSDVIRQNADELWEAGFETVLTRDTNGSCCKWCDEMSGAYARGSEPADFWKAHKDCTCTFGYQCRTTGTVSKHRFITTEWGLSKEFF